MIKQTCTEYYMTPKRVLLKILPQEFRRVEEKLGGEHLHTIYVNEKYYNNVILWGSKHALNWPRNFRENMGIELLLSNLQYVK